jgi:Fur family transcriptional regulator, ferric uptake regulator
MKPFRDHSQETFRGPKAQGEPAYPRGDEGDQPATPAGWRTTRQRDAVIALLGEMDGFHSAQAIHSALRTRGEHIGLTTVYRVLQALADFGGVDVLSSASGDSLYRLCGSEHHHHLMCRSCGRVAEVTGPAVEEWAERVAAEHGFSDVGHTLEITGTCAECALERSEQTNNP